MLQKVANNILQMNTFGKIFRLTSFGESHGRGIGGIIDGCPAGVELDIELIQKDWPEENQDSRKLQHNVKNRIR